MINFNCKTSLEIRECFEKWVQENPKLIYGEFENEWMAVELSKNDVLKLMFEDTSCNYPNHARTVNVLSVCNELKKELQFVSPKSNYDKLNASFRWNSLNNLEKRQLIGFECRLPNTQITMLYLLLSWENGYYYGVCGLKNYERYE